MSNKLGHDHSATYVIFDYDAIINKDRIIAVYSDL